MSEPYDKDVFAWASEQVSLLRSGRLSEIDVDHIAEEIEVWEQSEARVGQPADRSAAALAQMAVPTCVARKILAGDDSYPEARHIVSD